MSIQPNFDRIIHDRRAEELQQEARDAATTLAMRRAARLEAVARLLERWSAWSARVANRLSVKAVARRARLL